MIAFFFFFDCDSYSDVMDSLCNTISKLPDALCELPEEQRDYLETKLRCLNMVAKLYW